MPATLRRYYTMLPVISISATTASTTYAGLWLYCSAAREVDYLARND